MNTTWLTTDAWRALTPENLWLLEDSDEFEEIELLQSISPVKRFLGTIGNYICFSESQEESAVKSGRQETLLE